MKIHYHSDCPFFAGCERMLVNFWLNKDLRNQYEVSFSYRASSEYSLDLYRHIHPDFPVAEFSFPRVNWPARNFKFPFSIFSKITRWLFRLVTKIPFFLIEVLQLYNFFRQKKPDIVHLNNGGFPAARSVRAAAISARLAGVKNIVMVVNNLAEPYETFERITDYFFDRLVALSVNYFVTGSGAAADQLAHVLQLKPHKILSIHNGIRSKKLNESALQVRTRLGIDEKFKGCMLGVVALMEERKGHAVLLQALNILNRSYDNLSEKLIVFLEGDGPLKESLIVLAKQFGLERLVFFPGVERDVHDFITACDLIVLPSIADEDFPNVILEAMSLAKPVIASAIAGTVEQIDHQQTGFLVDPGNPDAIAQAIKIFIEGPNLLVEYGVRAQKKFNENFTADLAVEKYLNLYGNLIKENQ